jgi:hypothetical protein
VTAFVPSDLHGHTLFSDGRATPEAYVDARRLLGMKVVAVADHDLFGGVRRAAAAVAATRAPMIFVPAAEITAFLHFGTSEAEQFHVLAYFPPDVLRAGGLERTFLYQRGLRVQAAWRAFVLEWMSALAPEDRDAIDPEGELAKLDAARFPALQSTIGLVMQRRHPLVESLRKAHVRFWDEGRALFGWTPEECIDAIRADGAVDVVAHPARYRDKERTRAVAERAWGIEVYTSRHKPEVAAWWRVFAEERGKHWTASADDHQNARYVRPPCGTPLATVERMLRRALPIEMVVGCAPPHGRAVITA